MTSPSPGSNTSLSSVAATSAVNAWAVGTSGTDTGTTTLIERWNGITWTAVTSPSPGASSDLGAVAATSATSAWAAGFTPAGARHRAALRTVERHHLDHRGQPGPAGRDHWRRHHRASRHVGQRRLGGRHRQHPGREQDADRALERHRLDHRARCQPRHRGRRGLGRRHLRHQRLGRRPDQPGRHRPAAHRALERHRLDRHPQPQSGPGRRLDRSRRHLGHQRLGGR